MTPEQYLQTIEAVLLDPSIKGFSFRQVMALQESVAAIRKHLEELKQPKSEE